MKRLIRKAIHGNILDFYNDLVTIPAEEQYYVWVDFRKEISKIVSSRKRSSRDKKFDLGNWKYKRKGKHHTVEQEGKHFRMVFLLGSKVDVYLYKGDDLVHGMMAFTSCGERDNSDKVGATITDWLDYTLSDKNIAPYLIMHYIEKRFITQ